MDNYNLLYFIQCSEQVSTHHAITDFGDGSGNREVRQELVRHLVTNINDALQKADEIWTQATISKLVFRLSESPPLHILSGDIKHSYEQALQADLKNLSLSHEDGVLLKDSSILVLIEPGDNLSAYLFA